MPVKTFAVNELAEQLTWSETFARLFHYRDRDGFEVDAVLESDDGGIVAVEVKATSTPRAEDFRGVVKNARRDQPGEGPVRRRSRAAHRVASVALRRSAGCPSAGGSLDLIHRRRDTSPGRLRRLANEGGFALAGELQANMSAAVWAVAARSPQASIRSRSVH